MATILRRTESRALYGNEIIIKSSRLNADDHARAKTLVADLHQVQDILRRLAGENQALADENEQLRVRTAKEVPQPAPNVGGPTHLTPKQLASRWSTHHGSILRKIRHGELPCIRINSRTIRIPMPSILTYEQNNLSDIR